MEASSCYASSSYISPCFEFVLMMQRGSKYLILECLETEWLTMKPFRDLDGSQVLGGKTKNILSPYLPRYLKYAVTYTEKRLDSLQNVTSTFKIRSVYLP